MQNRTTGREIKTITLPAPPRDEPLNLGVISDDNQRPSLTSGPTRLTNFDTGGLLTFTFSEAMDADSLKAGIIVERVRNGQRTRVEGEFRVSNGNTVVTFVPKFALGVGEEYSITFVGDDALGGLLVPGGTAVTDASGNSLSTTRFRITTFKPRTVGMFLAGVDSSGDQIEFKDVEIRRKKDNDKLKTYLVTTADSRIGYRLATFDVTDPTTPVQLQTAAGGSGKKRVILVPDIGTPEHPAMPLRQPTALCDGKTKTTITSPFKGDLAVTTSWNTYYSYLSFYDVTNPENPCLLANKLLTAAPDTLTPFSQRGTVHALGYARGVATIQHSQGYAAYAAVGEVGLFAADIGKDIPEYGPDDRVKEGAYSGDYYDVVNVSDRLLAANRGDSRLDLFDPSLTLLGSIELPAPPRRIVTVSGYGVDRNEDGLLTPDEQFDLALVTVDDPATGAGRIEIVDITNDADLRVVGEITMPGITRDLAVDPDRRRLFAAGAGQASDGRRERRALHDRSLESVQHRHVRRRQRWTRRSHSVAAHLRDEPQRHPPRQQPRPAVCRLGQRSRHLGGLRRVLRSRGRPDGPRAAPSVRRSRRAPREGDEGAAAGDCRRPAKCLDDVQHAAARRLRSSSKAVGRACGRAIR